MARDEGMALAPWGSLGGGHFKTEEQRQKKASEGRQVQPTDDQVKISRVLEAVAARKATAITSVAMAYVMHKAPYVFPIVGGRTIDHLRENIKALLLHLDPSDIDEIDTAVPFDLGFPNTFFYPSDGRSPAHPQQVGLLSMGGTYDYVPVQKPISPPQGGGE